MPLLACKWRDCDRCIFEAEMEGKICLACEKGIIPTLLIPLSKINLKESDFHL